MPFPFYASLGIFPPKGTCPQDQVEVIREPEKTRPLNLKNTDNKAICGTVISGYYQPMKESTHRTQRGFVPGRQLTQNVLDLDSASRILAFMNRKLGKNTLPAVLALFDFIAAFPLVFHSWIMLVLELRGFPEGLIDFVKSLYARNYTTMRHGGFEYFLYWIFSGVHQGCPASAFLFDVAVDPILVAFEEALEQGPTGTSNPAAFGIVRTCADDIGTALLSLNSDFLTGQATRRPRFAPCQMCLGPPFPPDKRRTGC